MTATAALRRRVLVVAVVLALGAGGCGKKGPPRPPIRRPPQAAPSPAAAPAASPAPVPSPGEPTQGQDQKPEEERP